MQGKVKGTAVLLAIVIGGLGASACGSSSSTKQGENQAEAAKASEPAKSEPTETTEPEETPEPAAETPPTTTKKSGASVAIVEQGFQLYQPEYSDGIYGVVGLKLQNQGDEDAAQGEVVVNWLDAAGTPLATSSDYTSSVPAGQTVDVSLEETGLPAGVASMSAQVFFREDSFFETDHFLNVTAAGRAEGQYGDTSITGRIQNPTAAIVEDATIECVTRGADGAINGGGFTYPDTLAPNGEIAFEIGSLGHEFATAECTASF